ncbi:molybdopterin-dependent oxidoreductase [Novosphingobium beihaiensis]|uniref:Molybdopterin-dependent oxidoreductase n=1 Tax=Novosphingobium beihaiensis TaxID=2930389 RepID=A0ABT0BQ41_9SPHN|nr:molybdopterin-dependent oxidoreductase [Novosphingobium beihaiensis]MCJ2187175.1 molybdopterin-dependent oxidoreductase [Novosphingobium beihaiensis]
MSRLILSRRTLIRGSAAGAGSLMLSGCDKLFENPTFRHTLEGAEDLHKITQRALGRHALAREFTEADMSPRFRANGSREVADPVYRQHLAQHFAQWSLRVEGLVEKPLTLPLDMLKSMPQRTQITRHDCVEGWSAIGKWTGPRLGPILNIAGLKPQAKYIVFHCADLYHGRPYYESIDLVDAFHPQTILAWAMNGKPLEQAHGAPLRLRVERQLGYKHAKFVTRIEAVSSLDGIYGGKGGYWEDNGTYAWYAGI